VVWRCDFGLRLIPLLCRDVYARTFVHGMESWIVDLVILLSLLMILLTASRSNCWGYRMVHHFNHWSFRWDRGVKVPLPRACSNVSAHWKEDIYSGTTCLQPVVCRFTIAFCAFVPAAFLPTYRPATCSNHRLNLRILCLSSSVVQNVKIKHLIESRRSSHYRQGW
jgi:hypothetical protein